MPFSQQLPPELALEAEALRRRQAIAQAMMSQSMQPVQAPEVKGRFSVPVSPLQGVAQLAQAYFGNKGMERAEQGYAGLASKQRKGVADALTQYQTGMSGTPERTVEPSVSTDELGQPMPMITQPAQPATPEARRAAISQAMVSNYPQLRQLAGVDLAQMNRAEDMKLKATETRETQRLHDERLRADRENAIKIAAAARQPRAEPAPSVTQIVDPLKPDQMLSIDTRVFNEAKYRAGDRSGVIGVSGKEPTAAKREEKAAEGKDLLKSELDNLREHYRVLNDARAIPSSDRGLLSNVASSIQASAPGQIAGRVTGTKEQDARNQIQSSRLRVMNAIKNATGMSAQQMNSNVELKTWLDSLTDPSKTYESNIGIINAIEDAFVKGKGKTITQPDAAAASAATSAPRVVDW